MNQIVFDKQAKEFVQISNGTANLDGTNFVPTEAVALRLIQIAPDGKPELGFTYRGVDATQLSPLGKPWDFNHFKHIFETKKPEHYTFIGRV